MKRISIDDIPGGITKRVKYPYAEWQTLAVDEATIVDIPDGIETRNVQSAVNQYIRIHHLGLQTRYRKGVLYVARIAEDE